MRCGYGILFPEECSRHSTGFKSGELGYLGSHKSEWMKSGISLSSNYVNDISDDSRITSSHKTALQAWWAMHISLRTENCLVLNAIKIVTICQQKLC